MTDYRMIVVIPINNVPDNTSIQEAKVICKSWLANKIPDAKLVEFKKVVKG